MEEASKWQFEIRADGRAHLLQVHIHVTVLTDCNHIKISSIYLYVWRRSVNLFMEELTDVNLQYLTYMYMYNVRHSVQVFIHMQS